MTAAHGYAAYCDAGMARKLLLIPANDLLRWSESMNETITKTRVYWHIHISADFQLIRKAGASGVDLSNLTWLLNKFSL